MDIPTIKDTTGQDAILLYIDGSYHTVNGNAASVIHSMVEGINRDFELTVSEYLTLKEEIKADISPYAKAFEIVDGSTFGVEWKDVRFFDAPIGNCYPITDNVGSN